MSDKIGKYYWVRTEAGKEIAFKRNSGTWEMHGIDCKEDLRDLILNVYEEVANGLNKQPEEALTITDVVVPKGTLPHPDCDGGCFYHCTKGEQQLPDCIE